MYFTYIWRELRRRSKQAIVIAIGLAIGIGLVMTVSSASAGVKNAQADVLHSLYGVGTDMTVAKSTTTGNGGFNFGGIGFRRSSSGASGPFGGRPAGSAPTPGTKFSRNRLQPVFSNPPFSAAYVSKISAVRGVAAASGGLLLTDVNFSGVFPSFTSGSPPVGRANFNLNSFSVDGVAISNAGVGPLTSAEITKGSYFAPSDSSAHVAVVTSSYASAHKLHVGSTADVGGTSMKVIGIAALPSGSADVYIPLTTAQTVAGLKNDVNIVYVSATSASDVSSLATTVGKIVPKSTVTTSADLAKEVTGSLSSASNLATNLGKWLSFAALAVAFVVAALLMVAAVSRRVREFGTLKAIGWRTRRIVGQVTGEGVTLGIVGGVLGLILGVIGSEIVSAVAPALTATVGAPGSGGTGGFPGGQVQGPFAAARPVGASGAGGAHTVLVHLTAPLQGGSIGLAIALAIGGGLIAGILGSWRAARLRPATALGRVA